MSIAYRVLLAALAALAVLVARPAPAQANTLVGGAITASTTWTTANSPYEVTSTIVVYNGARLTIQPGVTVLFHSNTGMDIAFYNWAHGSQNNVEQGALTVSGTAAAPVLFAPFSGIKGDWQGLAFGQSSQYGGTASSLAYLTVDKAGQSNTMGGTIGATSADVILVSTGSTFTFDHVTTTNSTGVGLFLSSSALTATNVTATGNASNGVSASSSTLNLSGATITGNAAAGVKYLSSGGSITGNTISGNGSYGLDTSGGAPSITGNTFSSNGAYGMRYRITDAPVITGNTLTSNTSHGIECVGGTLTANHAWSLQNGETSFTVTTAEIVVYNGARLTVGGGNTVYFASGTSLIVAFYNWAHGAQNGVEQGALTVNGTAALPVLFTSQSGATNGWKGVSFGQASQYAGLTSSLSYLTVQYAGQAQTMGSTIGSTSAGLLLVGTGTNFVFNNVAVNQTTGSGLFFSGAAFGNSGVVATGCSASQNTAHNLYMSASSGYTSGLTLTQGGTDGGYFDASTVTLLAPTVTGNTEGLHVRNNSAPTVTGGTLAGNTNYSVYTEDLASRVTVTGATVTGNGLGADHAAGTSDDSYTMRVSINSTVNTNSFSGNGKQGVEMVGGTLTANGRWYLPGTGTFQPYVLLNESVIYNGARLTVDAGVTVQFASATSLIVAFYNYAHGSQNNVEQGALSVNGTASAPVLFTSQSGATNGWKGVAFGQSSQYGGTASQLTYLTVEKAGQAQTMGGTIGSTAADVILVSTGSTFTFDHVQTNQATGIGMVVSSSSLTSTNATATGNTGNGIYAASSTLNLSGATVSGNTAVGVYYLSSGGSITGNTISGNGSYGLDTSGAAPSITGNTFSSNGAYGMRYRVTDAPTITGNTLTSNTSPGIECVGGTLTANHTWATQLGEPFVTVTGGSPVVYNGAALTVQAGNTIKFSSGTGLVIGFNNWAHGSQNNVEQGSLQVQGTDLSPVLFTAANGVAGGWQGIYWGQATNYGGTLSTVNYAIIEKAGQAQTMGNTIGSTSANVAFISVSQVLNNVTVAQGSGAGIFASGSSSTVRNAIVTHNAGYGLFATGGAPSFTYGDTFQNTLGNSGWVPGAHSIAVDPLLTNYVGGDYHLNPGSPAIDAGVVVSGLAYLGSAPDMGAVEYGAATNCANPSTPNGSPCNDGNACTQSDTCQNSFCVGSSPIVCAASDQCHAVGTCNPTNGACSNPAKVDGSACNDGNACTQADTCQSGACTGASPVACQPLDQCHSAGTCAPTTGVCSNPVIGTGVYATYYRDADGDGYGNAAVTTQACSLPAGYVANSTDCNDASAGVHPGAAELCNGVDDNCNGQIDEGLTTTYYADADGDGYGNAAVTTQACGSIPPAGYAANSADCNDANAAVHPGATELCNGVDDNCNGQTDEGNPGSGFACNTGNLGVCAAGTTTCAAGAVGCVQLHQPSAEVCDGLDNNCDGRIDEGVKTAFYRDADGDGYGNAAVTTQACSAPAGYVANSTDCNDGSAGVHPNAPELCNGVDDNCNGQIDEGALLTFHADVDGDGYGDPAVTAQACAAPAGYVANGTDCNDGNAAVHPGAAEACNGVDDNCDGQVDEGNPGGGAACGTGLLGACAAGTITCAGGALGCHQNAQPAAEVCNGLDDNCDGQVDEGVLTTFYRDADGDGHGDATVTTQACAAPAGYVASADDCNDGNAAVYPGAPELCDGLDNNCNGVIDDGITNVAFYADADGDGYGNPAVTVQACAAPAGYVANGGDCNDGSAAVHPGAAERCNGVDDNCDGVIDDGLALTTFYPDADGDGYGDPAHPVQACAAPPGTIAAAGDCNDGNAAVHPGAAEVCDGVDNDCNGAVDDGTVGSNLACATGKLGACAAGTTACAAGAMACHQNQQPSAEVCDGVDNNCDGQVDEGVKLTFHADADGDGYGDPAVTVQACAAPAGYVANGADCNDGSAAVHPGATEVCNGVDDNCDGQVDEGVTHTYYADADGDGYGNAAASIHACAQPTGYVSNATDCDDTAASVHPGATEICDGVDDNCDGQIDEGNPGGNLACNTGKPGACAPGTTACSAGAVACSQLVQPSAEICDGVDNNCDGAVDEGNPGGNIPCNTGKYGACAAGLSACSAGTLLCAQTVFPTPEVCNGIDDDCNGVADDGLQITSYLDADGDGYGTPNMSVKGCSVPPGYVANFGDCNDNDPSIHPGAAELCDGVDNNCDGVIDNGNLAHATFYADADHDGYGDPGATLQACAPPPGYVANSGDCNDASAAIHPGATEICNGVDDNCDGQIDEGVTHTFYVDADGDGYGDAAHPIQGCAQPPGTIAVGGDCNDGNPAVHPGATEVCNGVDDNCDGQIDEGVGATYYADADGDGFGNAAAPIRACAQPSGYVANASDCNDTVASIHPGATEICNGVDDNCNGQTDEGNPGGGLACATGKAGACSGGTTTCSGGAVACHQNQQPSAEVCDGVDNNCDGQIDEGNPGGGVACGTGKLGVCSAGTTACSAGGLTCHQNQQPSAEICDGLDNDCNGVADDGNPGGGTSCSTGKLGVCATGTTSCNAGAVSCAQNVQPSAETCDGLDNNCNGQVDEGNPGAGAACNTGKLGVCAVGTTSCAGGVVACKGNVLPSLEVCDGLDNNCDGQVDEGLLTTYYRDADGDGYGNPANAVQACTQPPGYSLNNLDCNDANAAIHPFAQESCNGIDDNCDGQIDEGGDGVLDCDHNGVADACQADQDHDGVPDVCDNCPGVPNPSQRDTNHNGVGDACDRICLTIERGVFGTVLDTQVASDPANPAVADQVFGASNVSNSGLVAKGPRRALFWFDVSMVPPTAVLSGASMTVYTRLDTALQTVNVHRVTAPWNEVTTTWNTFANAYDPLIEGSFSNKGPTYAGALSVDLTNLTQEWIEGNFVNDGVLLEQTTVDASNTNYWTSEYLQPLRPRLNLCYFIPG